MATAVVKALAGVRTRTVIKENEAAVVEGHAKCFL